MYPLSHTVAHDVVRATDAHRLEGFHRWTRRHAESTPTARTDATGPRRRPAGR